MVLKVYLLVTNDSNWHLSEVTLKEKTYLFKSHAMCRCRFVVHLDSEIVFSEAVWHAVPSRDC